MTRHIDITKHNMMIQMAAHAIGLDHKQPYQRYGNLFYRPHRNHYTIPKKGLYFSVWDSLCVKGYAERRNGINPGSYVYCLTRAGLDWLGQELGITIYNEEN